MTEPLRTHDTADSLRAAREARESPEHERAMARLHVMREMVALVAFTTAGVALALTGHEQPALTLIGGVLAMFVPGASPRTRTALVMLASAGGCALGSFV